MNATDKKVFLEMREDARRDAERAERDANEARRISWAQANGNDSGYDPYYYL